MSKLSHIERTAHEPRGQVRHTLLISHITQVTPAIRLFRLSIFPDDFISFLPGQWVDLYPPDHTGITKPGGFTITSPPSLAISAVTSPGEPYLELAVQSAPENPVAAYLFRPADHLLRTPVSVRVGGSFVFPPSLPAPSPPPPPPSPAAAAAGSPDSPPPRRHPFRRAVFVAGGMGINPMMSMLSHIAEPGLWQQGRGGRKEDQERYRDLEVRVLYSVKDPATSTASVALSSSDDLGNSRGGSIAGEDASAGGGEVIDGRGILFLERIADLFGTGKLSGGVQLFVTSGGRPPAEGPAVRGVARCDAGDVSVLRRRMTVRDVEEAVGGEKDSTVVYICGVPTMTDEFVEELVSPEGFRMDKERVLFEKWW